MNHVMKLIFCVWLGIHRCYKFIEFFQVGVIKHAKSDSKQQTSYISRMNGSLKLIFLYVVGHSNNIYLI